MKLDRAMRALALAAALLVAPRHGAAATVYDSPSGLTLVAQPGGRYLLLWEPIYRDDLLGYSVWLRKPGDAEFVRLSVPVKVGKEVKKQPMTPEAKVVLAFGRERDDLEMTVVAEYEEGSSARAPVARSAAARRSAAALAADAAAAAATAATVPGTAAEAAGAPAALTRASTVRERSDALANEEATVPGGDAPWDKDKQREARPLVLPPGTFKSKLGGGFDYRHFTNGGYNVFSKLGLIGTDISPTTMVNWQRSDVRTTVSIPLTLRYGMVKGLEAWARASYQAEDYFIGEFKVDGEDFSWVRFVHVDAGGNVTYLSNPSSTGLGDVSLGLRGQPWDGQPLVLNLGAALPTGTSRFESMLDWKSGRGSPAGTGEGILRLTMGAEWGLIGGPNGLSFHAAYSPGGQESYTMDNGSGGPQQAQTAVHGDIFEAGGVGAEVRARRPVGVQLGGLPGPAPRLRDGGEAQLHHGSSGGPLHRVRAIPVLRPA